MLDLLQLGVPKLFASVGDGGEDSAVQQEMAAFLKDYINRSALKHSILSHMTKIMVRATTCRLISGSGYMRIIM